LDSKLETTVIHTRKTGTRIVAISAEAARAEPRGVTAWTLEHEDCSNRVEIELGRRVAASGLIGGNGAFDRDIMLLFKGMVLAVLLVKGWDVKGADDKPLPVTPENIEAMLPKAVLVEFGFICLFGKSVTAEEEAEAEKKG
jgi:hypothetical protein